MTAFVGDDGTGYLVRYCCTFADIYKILFAGASSEVRQLQAHPVGVDLFPRVQRQVCACTFCRFLKITREPIPPPSFLMRCVWFSFTWHGIHNTSVSA